MWCQETQRNAERGIQAAYLRRLALKDARLVMRIRHCFPARKRCALFAEQTFGQPALERKKVR